MAAPSSIILERDVDAELVQDPLLFYEEYRSALGNFQTELDRAVDAADEEVLAASARVGIANTWQRADRERQLRVRTEELRRAEQIRDQMMRQHRVVVIDPSATTPIQREIVVDMEGDAAGMTFGQIWRRFIWPRIQQSSGVAIWRVGWRIVVQSVSASTRVRFSGSDLRQAYRDGVGHCVLTPIETWLTTRIENTTSESSLRKLQMQLQKCRELMVWYKNGVPEDALHFVATRLKVRISLADPFGKNVRTFNDENAFAKKFEFRNVSWNHVQEGACCTEVCKLSSAGMLATLQMLRDGKMFYLLKKSGCGQLPTRIDSYMGRYTLEDPDRDIFQAARDRYKLDGYAIDAQKEPALARFVDAGCRVTSHARFHCGVEWDADEPAEYKTLDLSKAYTRGSALGARFQGYLVAPGHVRRLDGVDGVAHMRAHPGIYCVRGVDLSECTERIHDYAVQFKFDNGSSHILPSPELLWWYDHGARFTVSSGTWGTVLPDIDWGGLGLLDVGTGPLHAGTSRYKIWCGQLGFTNRGTKTVWLPGDARWAAYLASCGYNASHYDGDGDVAVRLPAAASPSLKHVFAFVTSYTRVHVLEKLKSFDPQNVRGVMLDAIVYVGDAPDGAETPLWQPKETVARETVESYAPDGWYGTSGIWEGESTDDSFITAAPSNLTHPLMFLEGAGGSGKSHSVLADGGFRDVLFAAPTWSLVCFMMRKYGCAGTTVHRLAGEWYDVDAEGNERTTRCRPYHDEHARYPAVIFVDEATMIDRRMLDKVIATYAGKSQVIIAGDIRVSGVPADRPPVWFQCRNRTQVFDPRAAGCRVVTYGSDYRASGALVDCKAALREAMLEVFLASTADDPGDDALDARDVQLRAASIFASRVCTASTCLAEYKKGDTILVGTHELADGWNEALKDRDVKYRVVSHTSADIARAQLGEDVSLTGDIVTEKGDRTCVFTLAFTIHSFQGKTFEGSTLWIDARRAWDYAMLYTAISRCRTLEQVRLFFE